MIGMSDTSSPKGMEIDCTRDLFQFKPILRNVDIFLCSYMEHSVRQILCIVNRDNEVILLYLYGELPPVIKVIPWFTEKVKEIQAICFDPTATWLLLVCFDGSLYILPALSLVDKKLKIDCKWCLNDLTYFKHSLTVTAKPTCVTWWQTLDSNQNALVGYENGTVALVSLTDGRCISTCNIGVCVTDLILCSNTNINSTDPVSLLINGENSHQWRLLLESQATGYLWPPDITTATGESTKNRLFNLKQLGVDKLATIKQKLSELSDVRLSSNDSKASDSSDSSQLEKACEPELLPHLCDTYFSPQHARNRDFFSAFYRPSSLLTVHSFNVESAPLFVHKVIPCTRSLLLTDYLIFTINEDGNVLSLISSYFSECKLEGDLEFNRQALIQQFTFYQENILKLYRLSDFSSPKIKCYRNCDKGNLNCEHVKINKPKINTCIVVTDKCIYKIIVDLSPVYKAVSYIIDENRLEKAEKICLIFNMNLQQILEYCGDIKISQGSYHSGIILYKLAKVHLMKRVLKLALVADCRTLLKFVNLCLSSSRVDMSFSTKVHIGNLAVLAYTEQIMRSGGAVRTSCINDFKKFLCQEEFYDHILAVNIACQIGHWNTVTLLAKSRGLQPVVVNALGRMLEIGRISNNLDNDFLYTLSEPSLTQSLLNMPNACHLILQYIRTNLSTFPVPILHRLCLQLDPSQPSAVPLVNRLFEKNRSTSSSDTAEESISMDDSDFDNVTVKDFIETFILVLVQLTSVIDQSIFDFKLFMETESAKQVPHDTVLTEVTNPRQLSAGYKHAAVVRNGSLYTMGVASSGCLGLGPLLLQSSSPKKVTTLSSLKVEVFSVACGRKHTLALSNYGVYAWGSNSYGQLGLGSSVQESPYPQIIQALSFVRITDIVVGQYHSLALTSSGLVYTWGWGIHGQLGHGSCDNEFYPTLLDFPYAVKQAASGHAHTLLLTCDGRLFGFGSDVFGQLGLSGGSNKFSKPVEICVVENKMVPVKKISTSYFHNMAVYHDDKVYMWGTSPQEVKLSQTKFNQKQTTNSANPSESLRSTILVYSSDSDKKHIEQIAVGYKYSSIIHDGKLLWGRNRSDEFTSVKLNRQNNLFSQRFVDISCGLDYAMAVDYSGRLLAWGSPLMAQVVRGKSAEEGNYSQEEKQILLKNTKRLVKLPGNIGGEHHPVEVSGLPTMRITFNSTCSLTNRIFPPYYLLSIENDLHFCDDYKNCSKKCMSHFTSADSNSHFKYSQKTLHYTLQCYFDSYDNENIILSCLKAGNFQAASKVALLDGRYSDSLSYQLLSLKRYIESVDVDMSSVFKYFDDFDIDEKSERHVEVFTSKIDVTNESAYIDSSFSPSLSLYTIGSSSSLDSIRQWGDEVEHQGGHESPCVLADSERNSSHFIHSPATSPVRRTQNMINTKREIPNKNLNNKFSEEQSKKAKEILEIASDIVEFYTNKIHSSENHILMQNVLMKCIEFWLTNSFPVSVLEKVLIKNLDKYFYPLSILLFCKNFDNNVDDDQNKEGKHHIKVQSRNFLKQFSTKFCLHLCSMVLQNVNKS